MNDLLTRARELETHTVDNQAPPLVYDAWATDLALREAIAREGGGFAEAELADFGPKVGGPLMELGRLANENRPKLRGFDRYGHRIDQIEFHPAYHELMGSAVTRGVTGYHWRNESTVGSNVARFGFAYLHGQADQGSSCPLTMTYACVPTLRHEPAIAEAWVPKAIADRYDPRSVVAAQKAGVTIGMAMTEKQGGSDVRSNTTRAQRIDSADRVYALVGHKWFFSAPMCDAWLVLAQAERGLSCFLMPRLLPDGTRNAIHVQRLKDKLGDWSNASSEVELRGAVAWMVGAEGKGVANILEMVALTRQDCMIGSAALMRQSLVQALHHARHRKAFGRLLVDHPLMVNVLSDLALESEAHTALAARVSRAIGARGDAHEAAFARIATAIGKYWVCKRAVPFVNEAQECLGGAGYVEDGSMARLYRQAPLNSIWEGSGNIQCLDVLRAIGREPETRDALFAELAAARGFDARFDAELPALAALFEDEATLELRSRYVVERLALALEAATLLRAGRSEIVNTFISTRIAGGAGGRAFGTLPVGTPFRAILDRAWPA